MVLLIVALVLAMAMGMSLTAVSELGVSRTYGSQTLALQAAEAGLNHAVNLVQNFSPTDSTKHNFTGLLSFRGTGQEFPVSAADFIAGTEMITAGYSQSGDVSLTSTLMVPATEANGHVLRDANGNPIEGASYSVRMIDDEANPLGGDPALKVPNFNPGSTYSESTGTDANNPNIDKNRRVVIYSTGRFGNASVTLEGWVAFLPYPALSANGDIDVVGSADIKGAYGGVHSNEDLRVGNAATVEQSATASGTATIANPSNVGGFSGGGQARLEIPQFVTTPVIDPNTGAADQSPRFRDFLVRAADRLLVDPGFGDGAHENISNGNSNPGTQRLRELADRLNVSYTSLATALDTGANQGNNVQQTVPVAIQIDRAADGSGLATRLASPSDTGWSYTGGSNAHWGLSSTSAGGHTYYVVGLDRYNLSNPAVSLPNGGNVKITSNYGTPSNPVQISILTTGSIELAGNPNLVSNLQGLKTPLLPPFIKVDFLMAAVQDIQIRGDTDGAQRFSGISYAGEQVDLSGNGAVNGQVISLGNKNVSNTPVNTDTNTVTGSFLLTLNDGNSIGRISLYTWRQIKR
jgi:hypothetical protein